MKWKLKTAKNCKTTTFSRFLFVCLEFVDFFSWKRPNIAKPLQFHGVLFESLNFSRGIKNAFVGVMKQNNYKNSVSYHMYYHTCSIAYDDFFLTFHLFSACGDNWQLFLFLFTALFRKKTRRNKLSKIITMCEFFVVVYHGRVFILAFSKTLQSLVHNFLTPHKGFFSFKLSNFCRDSVSVV